MRPAMSSFKCNHFGNAVTGNNACFQGAQGRFWEMPGLLSSGNRRFRRRI